MRFIGIDPLALYHQLHNLPYYHRTKKQLKNQQGDDTMFPFGRDYPFLRDRHANAGNMSSQYFIQDLFVARKIF